MCVPFPGKVTKELKELYNFMHNQMFQSSETWLLPNFPRDYLERKLGGLRRSPPPVRTEPVAFIITAYGIFFFILENNAYALFFASR